MALLFSPEMETWGSCNCLNASLQLASCSFNGHLKLSLKLRSAVISLVLYSRTDYWKDGLKTCEHADMIPSEGETQGPGNI